MNFLQKTKRKVAPSLPPFPAVSFAQYVSQRMGLSICSYTKTPFNKHIPRDIFTFAAQNL